MITLQPHISTRTERIPRLVTVWNGEVVVIVLHIHRHESGVGYHGAVVGAVDPLMPLKCIPVAQHGENMVLDVDTASEHKVAHFAVECFAMPGAHRSQALSPHNDGRDGHAYRWGAYRT